MPALDASRNAPRRAVRRVNQQAAGRVRRARRQVVQQFTPAPARPSNDLARTGARAGIRPRPGRPSRPAPTLARPTNDLARTGRRAGIPPQRFVPVVDGNRLRLAPEHRVRATARREILHLFTPGGSLQRKELARQRLQNLGVLPSPDLARLTAQQEAILRRPIAPAHHGHGNPVSRFLGGAAKLAVQGLELPARPAQYLPVVGGAVHSALNTIAGAGRAAGAQVGTELMGQGDVAKLLSKAADFVVHHAYTAAAEPQFTPTRVAARGGRGGIAPKGSATVQAVPVKGTVAEGLIRDLAAFPMQAVPTLYELGAAGVEAAQGRTGRAKKVGKALSGGLIGHLLRGDFKGAAQYANEHPLFAALELRGGAAIVGRGAGAALRSAPSEELRRIGSTAREDVPIGGGMTARRHYSPDIFEKGLQVLAERLIGPRGSNVHELNRLVDVVTSMNESSRRAGRQAEYGQARRALPGRARTRAGRAVERRLPERARPERELVDQVIQRVVRHEGTVVEDLTNRRKVLDRVYNTEHLEPHQRELNRLEAQRIDRVLKSPKALANARALVAAGHEMAVRGRSLTGEAVRLKALDEDSTRAALFPFAQTHYGRGVVPESEVGAVFSDAPFRAARTREVASGRALRRVATEARQRVAKMRREQQILAGRLRGAREERARGYVPGVKYGVHHREEALKQQLAAKTAEVRRAVEEARSAVKAAREPYDAARAERVGRMKGGRVAVTEGGRRVMRYASLHKRNGEDLSNEEIVADMRRQGVPFDEEGPVVAYLPHRQEQFGPGAMLQQAIQGRPNLNKQRRTGEAHRTGAKVSGAQLAVEHLTHLRGVVDATSAWDRFIAAVGRKRSDGQFYTEREALDDAGRRTLDSHGNEIPGAVELVPVRAIPGAAIQRELAGVAYRQGIPSVENMDHLLEQAYHEATLLGDEGTRNVVLVPAPALKRFTQQMRGTTNAFERMLQAGTGVFRRTVLPFSTKWVTGNTAEMSGRLAFVGAGPNAARIGRKMIGTMIQIDRQQGEAVKAELIGGQLFGQRNLTITRKVATAFEDTRLEKPAALAAVIRHAPGLKLIFDGAVGLTDGIFALNRWLEQQGQYAALGKYGKREIQEFTGSWAKSVVAQQQAVEAIARRWITSDRDGNVNLNIPEVKAAADYMDETLGRYTRFDPATRRVIQTFAPFLPWYINAFRFVFWTLPTKHPIKMAVLTRAEAAFQQDYKDAHKDVPPGDLRAGIPYKGGQITAARYTPFGAFTNLPEGFGDILLPQLASTLNVFQGNAWTGKALRTSSGDTPDKNTRTLLGLYALLEAFLPGVQIGRRLREGGRTPFDDSTIFSPKTKPGTGTGTVNRIFNPLRPTYLRGGGGGGGGADSGWGTSGGGGSGGGGGASPGWGTGGGSSRKPAASGWGG